MKWVKMEVIQWLISYYMCLQHIKNQIKFPTLIFLYIQKMYNQQVIGTGLGETLQFTSATKLICKNENVTTHNCRPQKRYGHLSFIYKGKLYVIGGCLAESKNEIQLGQGTKGDIYCYSLEKQRLSALDDKKGKKPPEQQDFKWELVHAKFTPQADAEFRHICYCAYCVFPHKKRLYIFGGSTQDGKTSNNLFRLDLDTLQWSKPEQKGTIPKAREQAALSLYTKNDKNYLVLYGGANYQNYEIHSDINIYQIETKYWFPCHNLSSNFLQPRISPAICFDDNKIYVFGGYYLDVNLQKGYLNDLYEIQFNLSLQKGRPYAKSFVKRLDQTISSSIDVLEKPEKRCCSEMMIYNPDFDNSNITTSSKKDTTRNQWILLIGGQKSCDEKKRSISTLNDIWIFSCLERKWRRITCTNEFRERCSFTSVLDKQTNKIFIFGGIMSQQTILNDVISLKITGRSLPKIMPAIENSHYTVQSYEDLGWDCISLQGCLIDEVCDSITFPFSGIALIVDSFVNFRATFCDITYNINKNKNLTNNYIRFQSNAHFSMSNQIIVSHFTCLKGGIRTYVQGTDKKVKAEMKEDNLFREIGTNFVVGGLRLGDCIIFVNLNPDTFEILIIIVLRINNHCQNSNEKGFQDENFYRLFSFTIPKQEILSDIFLFYENSSFETQKRQYFFEKCCPEQYRSKIRNLCVQGVQSIRKGSIKNLFYIFRLRTSTGLSSSTTTKQQQLQLFPDMMKNDIIYGDRELIREIELQGIPVYDSMDVSLKSFISYLYMQGCETELTVSIHGLERKPIIMQDYLWKVDDMLKNKQIVEISNEFEFDCKIIELYYISEKAEKYSSSSKINSKFFGNGTLFYLKNRLIKRHGINLGDYLFHYKYRSIKQVAKERKSMILRSSNHYSVAQIFGHIEIPEAVPVNVTKTDYVFPVMLQRIQQKLKLMQDQIVRQKQIKANLKIKIVY